jgi:hypothetical protein
MASREKHGRETKKLPVSESGTPALHTTPRDKKLISLELLHYSRGSQACQLPAVYQAEMPEVVQLRQFDQLPY